MKNTTSRPAGYALITGASGGIGRQLALLFAADGINIMAVARNMQALQQLHDDIAAFSTVQVILHQADLSQPDAAHDLYTWCMQQGYTISYLVNNAGFGKQARSIDISYTTQEEILRLNITALTTLSILFGKYMAQRRHGKILNIGSLAAYQPTPYMAVYGATKAYVMQFSEALHAELAPYGVSVTVLNPGPTDTGFAATSSMDNSVTRTIPMASAASVAAIGYNALMQGKLNVVPGLGFYLVSLFTQLLPSRRLQLALAEKAMRGGVENLKGLKVN